MYIAMVFMSAQLLLCRFIIDEISIHLPTTIRYIFQLIPIQSSIPREQIADISKKPTLINV